MIRHISDTPDNTCIEFFHAQRNVGALILNKVSEEVNVWTIVKGLQLLCLKYSTVANLARNQLIETINSALGEN